MHAFNSDSYINFIFKKIIIPLILGSIQKKNNFSRSIFYFKWNYLISNDNLGTAFAKTKKSPKIIKENLTQKNSIIEENYVILKIDRKFRCIMVHKLMLLWFFIYLFILYKCMFLQLTLYIIIS